MASSVRIYAGTQEGLFIWRSKNGGWENVAASFETGTIDSVDGFAAGPTSSIWASRKTACIEPMTRVRAGGAYSKATFGL